MHHWGYAALTMAALCSLPAFCVPASADASGLTDVHTAAPRQNAPLLVSGSLSAQSAKLHAHTNSLQQTEQAGTADDASLSSAYYSMLGIKPGLPATCYGQPCSASACYPAALVTVKKHVNYVNVTAVVQFSRRYTVKHSTLLGVSRSSARSATLVHRSASLVLGCFVASSSHFPMVPCAQSAQRGLGRQCHA